MCPSGPITGVKNANGIPAHLRIFFSRASRVRDALQQQHQHQRYNSCAVAGSAWPRPQARWLVRPLLQGWVPARCRLIKAVIVDFQQWMHAHEETDTRQNRGDDGDHGSTAATCRERVKQKCAGGYESTIATCGERIKRKCATHPPCTAVHAKIIGQLRAQATLKRGNVTQQAVISQCVC